MPQTLVIFGSKSDSHVYGKLTALLEKRNLDFELKICSAHKNPEMLDRILKKKYDLVIAGAGLSAALPGVIASKITAPVIGIPCTGEFRGLDAFLSILQMPPGIAVLGVGVNDVKTAAENAELILQEPKTVAIVSSSDEKAKKASEILDKFGIKHEPAKNAEADINIIIQPLEKIKILKNNKINIYCPIKENTSAEDSIKLLKTAKEGLWVGINNQKNAAIAAAQILGKEKEILEYRKELKRC